MGDPSQPALITNDAIILGILMASLALVFYTHSLPGHFWRKFYTYVPVVFVCYFLPSVFSTLGLVPGDGSSSNLYFVASRYLLPTSLVLLTLSVDLKAIVNLGPKSIIMFLTGTLGIILGGPIAILVVSVFSPEVVGGQGSDAVWRGMTTIAGSWIGGGANQAAMKEIFGPSGDMFSVMVSVDIIIANIWMAILLIGVGRSDKIDKWLKADTSAIEDLKKRVEKYRASIAKMPTLADTILILGVGFGATGLAHWAAALITPLMDANMDTLARLNLTSFASPFFWLVVTATTLGLLMSFTPLKRLEGAGASRLGGVMIYILVATIGMQMNLRAIFENSQLFLVGLIWMIVHASLLVLVAKLIRAPYFFLAIGSQANVGGAASAPIVASAFDPALAPVGVLLAVLGYALGTYGALLCGVLMQSVAP